MFLLYKSKNLRIKSLRDNKMSHHFMEAFFSGTDDAAIRQEAMNVNHFLSLVVNNAGKYVARVTKREVIKEVVHSSIKREKWYPTYDDGKNVLPEENIAEDKVNEYINIEVYPLNIEVESDNNYSTKDWEADILEVQEQKKKLLNATAQTNNSTFPVTRENVKEPTLFSKAEQQQHFYNNPEKVLYNSTTEDKDYLLFERKAKKLFTQAEINLVTLRIVACCPFIDKSKISMTPQYAVSLPKFVRESFACEDAYFNLVSSMVEVEIADMVDKLAPEGKDIIADKLDEFEYIISEEIKNRLINLPQNPYIKYIIDTLDMYIV